MSDPLAQPRPKLYRFFRVSACLLAAAAVVFAAILFYVGAMAGPNGGAVVYGMIFPVVMLVGAFKLWGFGKVVEFTDEMRARERESGKKLTITDIVIYVVGIIFIAGVALKNAPGGTPAGLTQMAPFLIPVLIAAVFGGHHLLKFKRGETEHTEFTAKNMFNPWLLAAISAFMIGLYLFNLYATNAIMADYG